MIDKFLESWKPDEPIHIRKFAENYFGWCETNNVPKKKVNAQTLEPYGFKVENSMVIHGTQARRA
jgi:hypothetical protein